MSIESLQDVNDENHAIADSVPWRSSYRITPSRTRRIRFIRQDMLQNMPSVAAVLGIELGETG
jgi:hypothetical protein